MAGPTRPSGLRVCLLGGFRAVVDGVPVDDRWRLRKARTLVKLLAVAPGHRLHREALVAELYPDRDVLLARNNLHQAIHAARRVLGSDNLVLNGDIVALAPDVAVDADEFEEAATIAWSRNDVEQLRSALELWSGDLLPEDVYADWATPVRARLADLHAAVVTRLGSALIDGGDAEEAVALLEPAVQGRPVDESMHRALFSAYVAAGRRLDALAAYERLRDAIGEEYGAEPDAETKSVYRRLLGAGAPTPGVRHNLPAPTTSFVGRRRELGELLGLLQRTRLVTLTGPGGAGKTRLAVELARRAATTTSDYPEGSCLVELAGLRQGDLLVSAVAASLGIELPADRPSADALADQLAVRRLLLLLDNCEHLLDATAALVATMLARCPDLVVVTTSREPLGVPGEVVWRVPALELPSSGDETPERLARLEAVQLFVERARDAAPAFALDASTAPAVARICRRLDGIPLAVELAAARLAHLSVAQLADRLGELLVLLAHRGRGRLDRQQTLAATLDWSYDLLDDAERILFRRLATFAGGFDLDAVGPVCGRALDRVEGVLARLVDKSLVNADTTGEQARYHMLEVVRQYAEVRLLGAGEADECRRLHRAWFAAKAAKHDPDRAGPVAREPTTWFDREQDNIRTALACALAEEPSLALQLAACTWRFWLSRGQIADGLRWLALALEACPESSTLRSQALFATAVMQIRRGNGAPLRTIGDDIAAIHRRHGDAKDHADALHVSGVLAFMSGDYPRAGRLSAQVERVAGAVPTVLASSQHFSGVMALNCGDFSGARACFSRADAALAEVPTSAAPFFTAISCGLAVAARGALPLPYIETTVLHGRRLGSVQARGHLTMSAALVERFEGHTDEALRLLEEARDLFRDIDDPYGEGSALLQRAHTLRDVGQWDAARSAFDAAGGMFSGLRHPRLSAIAMAGQALLEAAVCDADGARRLAARATTLMERCGDRPGVWYGMTSAALVEVMLGEFPAALDTLARAPDSLDIPGGHSFAGWHTLLRARLLAECGDLTGSGAALDMARQLFATFDDVRGVDACKEPAKSPSLG